MHASYAYKRACYYSKRARYYSKRAHYMRPPHYYICVLTAPARIGGAGRAACYYIRVIYCCMCVLRGRSAQGCGGAWPPCRLQRRLSVSAYLRTYENHALKEAGGGSEGTPAARLCVSACLRTSATHALKEAEGLEAPGVAMAALVRGPSAYVSIRQHTSSYVSTRGCRVGRAWRCDGSACARPVLQCCLLFVDGHLCESHTSAYVSIHQHASTHVRLTHVSIRSSARVAPSVCVA